MSRSSLAGASAFEGAAWPRTALSRRVSTRASSPAGAASQRSAVVTRFDSRPSTTTSVAAAAHGAPHLHAGHREGEARVQAGHDDRLGLAQLFERDRQAEEAGPDRRAAGKAGALARVKPGRAEGRAREALRGPQAFVREIDGDQHEDVLGIGVGEHRRHLVERLLPVRHLVVAACAQQGLAGAVVVMGRLRQAEPSPDAQLPVVQLRRRERPSPTTGVRLGCPARAGTRGRRTGRWT